MHEFWIAFWANLFASFFAVLFGVPFAFWINRRIIDTVEQRKLQVQSTELNDAIDFVVGSIAGNKYRLNGLLESLKKDATCGFGQLAAGGGVCFDPILDTSFLETVNETIMKHYPNTLVRGELAYFVTQLRALDRIYDRYLEFKFAINYSEGHHRAVKFMPNLIAMTESLITQCDDMITKVKSGGDSHLLNIGSDLNPISLNKESSNSVCGR